MLVPLVRTIQKYFPKAKLTWVISRPAYDLVEGMNGVEFVVIDKPNTLADFWRFKKQMHHREFDVLLAPQASFRTNLLYPLIKAKRKIGYDNHRANDGHRWFIKEKIAPGSEHTLEGFLKFAQPLGISEKVIRWDLPIAQADFDWAEHHFPKKGPVLVVNPAASKPERSWLVERYIEVLLQAQHLWGVQVILTGGPGAYDRQLAEQIIDKVKVIDIVGKTKPKQLLAVISKAQAVLCPDTGPSHMGAAVNTPVIALHAVTNPLVSGPYVFPHLVVNQYPQAVQQFLGMPYEQHVWGTHVHGDKTMELVTVQEVLGKLKLVFQ
jgi:heptosyltransferase I